MSVLEVGDKDGVFEYGFNHKFSAHSSSLFSLPASQEGGIGRVSALKEGRIPNIWGLKSHHPRYGRKAWKGEEN